MSTNRFFIILGLFFFFAIYGCIGCAPEIKDDRIDRKWVDSTAKKQKVLLSVEMDSLCEVRRDKFIKNAVDSILGERLAEMRDQNQ